MCTLISRPSQATPQLSSTIWLCGPLVVLLVIASQATAADESPNLVLMMADDMGMGDTSAYQDFTGNADDVQLDTPNMERLARMGVRFTDAHTPSSRCSPTRYALLTGRYPWRNRLKHWVLFGAQGDPMIEADRPTLATMLRDAGYRTAIIGKWHVGLRYRRADGSPAAGWKDADLNQPLHTTPLDHGFDYCRITSRSHGTSGPQPGKANNRPDQTVGPGHIHGRRAVGATSDGRKLVESGPHAYRLHELGGRHSDSAIAFLDEHLAAQRFRNQPFFIYYPCNSNHGPHTPDSHIGDAPVVGAARSKAGRPMNVRATYIFENDVALGRLLDYLQATADPRRPAHKLIDNTIVIFTSDNGAERDDNTATGPFRSNKGSVYEGGHRVPFIVAHPAGQVGDGTAATPGRTSDALVGLQDIYATLAEQLKIDLPDLRRGDKGAEDSYSMLAAWRGNPLPTRPLLFNDHKQSADHAASAVRLDNPIVAGTEISGRWKLFFDAALIRSGTANPVELFDLATDPRESRNRLDDPALPPLVEHLTRMALLHRTCGGHRLASAAPRQRLTFDWRSDAAGDKDRATAERMVRASDAFAGRSTAGVTWSVAVDDPRQLEISVSAQKDGRAGVEAQFTTNGRGLGISGGDVGQVDSGEALLIGFNRDVVVESVAIVAGNGVCGGFYRVGDRAPLAIYCVDGDIDAQDQSGILSDLGVLMKGQTLRLDTRPHYGSEAAGQWRLANITVRPF